MWAECVYKADLHLRPNENEISVRRVCVCVYICGNLQFAELIKRAFGARLLPCVAEHCADRNGPGVALHAVVPR